MLWQIYKKKATICANFTIFSFKTSTKSETHGESIRVAVIDVREVTDETGALYLEAITQILLMPFKSTILSAVLLFRCRAAAGPAKG